MPIGLGEFKDTAVMTDTPNTLIENHLATSQESEQSSKPALKNNPYADNRIKNRVRNLPFEADFYQNPTQFVRDMTVPGSSASQAFGTLIDKAGFEKSSVRALSKHFAVVGNSLISLGLAMRFGQEQKKICILELAHEQSVIRYLLENSSEVGVSDLLRNKTDLEYLMIQAKCNRPLPGVYIMNQGTKQIDWQMSVPKINALIATLSRKFHHVIISLPHLNDAPDTDQLIKGLGVRHLIAFDQENHLAQLENAVPNALIQLV